MADGTKRSSRAAARTRSAVVAFTGCGCGPGESTRETVVMDTPARLATSAMVTTLPMVVTLGAALGKRDPANATRRTLPGKPRPENAGRTAVPGKPSPENVGRKAVPGKRFAESAF